MLPTRITGTLRAVSTAEAIQRSEDAISSRPRPAVSTAADTGMVLVGAADPWCAAAWAGECGSTAMAATIHSIAPITTAWCRCSARFEREPASAHWAATHTAAAVNTTSWGSIGRLGHDHSMSSISTLMPRWAAPLTRTDGAVPRRSTSLANQSALAVNTAVEVQLNSRESVMSASRGQLGAAAVQPAEDTVDGEEEQQRHPEHGERVGDQHGGCDDRGEHAAGDSAPGAARGRSAEPARTPLPPHPVAPEDEQQQRDAQGGGQGLVGQPEHQPHVRVDAPAGELGHQGVVGEAQGFGDLAGGGVYGDRVLLGGPGALHLLHLVGAAVFGRGDFHRPAQPVFEGDLV